MRFIHAAFGVFVGLFLAAHTTAQDRPDPKEIARLSQPGPEHERLKGLVGTWFLTVSKEGGNVGQPGTAVFKSRFDGRFVTEEVKLPFGGFTFEWLGVYGYDRHKKKYTAVWVDNMDTTTESGEGEFDAAGKVLTFKGEHVDPRTGKRAPFVWRITRDGDTKLAIEMFEIDAAGKEKKVFDIRGEKAK